MNKVGRPRRPGRPKKSVGDRSVSRPISNDTVSQPQFVNIYNEQYRIEDFKYRLSMCNKADKCFRPVKEILKRDPNYFYAQYLAYKERPTIHEVNASDRS